MLIAFSAENYRSFRDRATLSMVAGADSSLPENVIWKADGKQLNLLRCVAIYGANASGKSNFISALSFMRRFVLTSHEGQKGNILRYRPFKLEKGFESKPSRFEVAFLIEKTRYVYGFSLGADDVHEEWLYSYPKEKRRVLFKRERYGKDQAARIRFGSHWKGQRSSLIPLVRHNALFLSIAAQFNNKGAANILRWFSEGLSRINTFPAIRRDAFLTALVCRDKKMRENMHAFVESADLGIQDYRVIFKKPMRSSDGEKLVELAEEELERMKDKDWEAVEYEFVTVHRAVGDDRKPSEVPFRMREESSGTQKIFGVAGTMIIGLSLGWCFFVDELDASMHPTLTKFIVKLFREDRNSKRRSQLIFTTHDANLLEDPSLLRRDQIWITEKDSMGASQLYSVWSFKGARKGENLRKSYLSGKFGGVPILTEPRFK